MSRNLRLLRTCYNQISQRSFFLQSSYHVPITVPMPALSPTMEEGSIVKWLVKVGDQVEIGDALCEVETDKAVVTVESSDDGTLAKILKEEGSKGIKLSVPIAIIAEEGENLSEAAKFVPHDPTLDAQDSTPIHTTPDSTPTQNSDSEPASSLPSTPTPVQPSNLSLSPAVRQAIEWYNINPLLVAPSGRNGRLLKGDVLKYISDNNLTKQDQTTKQMQEKPSKSSPPPATAVTKTEPVSKSASAPIQQRKKIKYEDLEMSNVRKIIAQRLTESKQQIPHSYNSISCNVNSLIQLRATLKQSGKKLSMNDFIVKAAGMALQQNKTVNSVWKQGGNAEESATSDISIAVATPGGLITPIIKSVESKGLEEISAETRSLAVRAREGKLKPEEFQGGSFTISNLGMFGISEFTAVINPPQTCILAVGTTKKKISLTSSDDINDVRVDNSITVTLSSDSRVVNDQEAGVFLESLKSNLENPINMIA